jgi:hypothetical protein
MEKRITLTEDVVISDPCYEIPTWCQGILHNVLPGQYVPMHWEADLPGWGERSAVLLAVHEDYINEPLHWRKTPHDIGVDSGQAGIFAYDTYRADALAETMEAPTTAYDGTLFEYPWRDKPGDAWYEQISRMTLSEDMWGTYSGGIVSRSGIGDGGYDCKVAKHKGKIVGILIDFHIIKTSNNAINYIISSEKLMHTSQLNKLNEN